MACPSGKNFTAERDRIVRALRGAGDGARRRASRRCVVRGSRCGRSIGWRAVHPKQIEALLQAGEQLRAVQKALRPSGAGALREASEVQRRLIGELTAAAEEVLAEGGFSAAGKHVEGVRRNLGGAAAATEGGGRSLLRTAACCARSCRRPTSRMCWEC